MRIVASRDDARSIRQVIMMEGSCYYQLLVPMEYDGDGAPEMIEIDGWQ